MDKHIAELGATSDPYVYADGLYFPDKDHPALKVLWYWPSFEPDEPRLFDRVSNGFFWHPYSMDCLQSMRDLLGKPVRVISGHRGPELNIRVGGSTFSAHKRIAFDVSTFGTPRQRADVVEAAIASGFSSVGLYPDRRGFTHFDVRPGRVWGRAAWADSVGLTIPTIRRMIAEHAARRAHDTGN